MSCAAIPRISLRVPLVASGEEEEEGEKDHEALHPSRLGASLRLRRGRSYLNGLEYLFRHRAS